MDDAEYRRLCAARDVMKRSNLHATAGRLRQRAPELADLVARVMTGSPVPKPLLHSGSWDDDFIYLELAPDQIQAIHDALRDEEASHAMRDTLLRNASAGQVAQLADLWLNAESRRHAS